MAGSFIPILVSIEGNIGAGKSTLLKALKESQIGWCFIDEPLDAWTALTDDEGCNILQLYYQDQRRWASTFQMNAALSRYQKIEGTIAIARSSIGEDQANSGGGGGGGAGGGGAGGADGGGAGGAGGPVIQVFITERCLDSDAGVFAKKMNVDGQLKSIEFGLYCNLHNHLRALSTPLSAIVYVNTEPTTCSERIKTRGREGEMEIPLDYLKTLDKFQKEWIRDTKVPCIKIDSTGFSECVAFITRIVAEVSI
jgi:deoxyadenosine/deoxycytidine kinase